MIVNGEPSLSPQGEEAWFRLKQHLEWCNHFALGFIFTDHPNVVNIFRERLASIYKARVTKLITQIPETPQNLVDQLLPQLLDPPSSMNILKQPWWIDLSHQNSDGWANARLSFLIRLNEQREPLRKSLKSPIVLLVPAGEYTRIKTLIPDLWAIRDFSITTKNWLSTETLHEAQPLLQPPERFDEEKFPISSYDRSMIEEWERLKNKGLMQKDFVNVSQRAFNAAYRTGQHLLAAEIANGQEVLARKIMARVGETPEALRDISVSLNNVGNTFVSLGQLDKSKKYFQEGFSIGTVLSGALPDHEDFKGLKDHFQNILDKVTRL
jgi:hypothetical protein